MSSLLSLSTLSTPAVVSLLALLPVALYLYTRFSSQPSLSASPQTQEEEKEEKETKSIMQPPRTDLAPPKDDPFKLEQLKEFNGADASKPIYVAIKGTVFDVTHKRDTYGPGCSYNMFAGKDASKALGKSSLKEEDAIPDWTSLDDSEKKVLDDWHSFFTKRYNIVGRVVDLPPFAANL
ncbi:hypothetical protein EIP91_001555 [Steccherinum ochraceum]|uniref:Cytochrome b5 heme-binding domain-containing protein n=1 Tax=Steccherinum ochraceum TaxID=92696 RepID=A0A4R0RMB0_9APHY|nr:hypothetical protein EIP91_001555 [Steccherinum ochraceum]